jgi:hypothetical protein
MKDDTTPIGPVRRIREPGNPLDEEEEAGGGETCDPIDATGEADMETPCVISFEEDYD